MDYQQLALELAQGSLTEAGLLRLRVSGESMVPALRPGDRVVIHPILVQDLQVGDLLSFRQGPAVVTHRVVRSSGRDFLTKGDNLRQPDAPVSPQEVLGRVVQVEQDGKVRSFSSRTSLAANRALGVLGWWEVRLWQMGRRSRQSGALTPGYRFLHTPFRLLQWLLVRIAA